jgi:hypothetical protein
MMLINYLFLARQPLPLRPWLAYRHLFLFNKYVSYVFAILRLCCERLVCFEMFWPFCFEVTHVKRACCVDILLSLNVFTDLYNRLNPL